MAESHRKYKILLELIIFVIGCFFANRNIQGQRRALMPLRITLCHLHLEVPASHLFTSCAISVFMALSLLFSRMIFRAGGDTLGLFSQHPRTSHFTSQKAQNLFRYPFLPSRAAVSEEDGPTPGLIYGLISFPLAMGMGHVISSSSRKLLGNLSSFLRVTGEVPLLPWIL